MKHNLRIGVLSLAFLMLGVSHSKGQYPGGVEPAAWYRADVPGLYSDAGTTAVSDQSSVYQWNSQIGSFPLIQSSAGLRPVYSNTRLANFNPSVTFDGVNDYLQFTAPANVNMIDRANGTIMAAGFTNQVKQAGIAGFHATMDYPGVHIGNPYKVLFYSGGPGFQGVSTDLMTATSPFTTAAAWQNGTGPYMGATVSLNGLASTYLDSESKLYNANTTTTARDFRIGADSNWGAFSGQLNEVLVYEDRLTEEQLDRVETYMAVKFGSTFANGTKDYKNSAGTTVWSASANSDYRFNIAGIGRDGVLYQKQSWSVNTGNQILIGVGGLANSNAANSGTLTNGQYLIWGDNGLDKIPSVSTTDFAGLSHLFASVWKVQNTGDVGTLRVAWPKTFSNLTLIQSTDETFDSGDLATSMMGEITINGVVYNYADVTLEDGTYFTLGAKLAGPGGVTAGLMMWHKADDGTVGAGPKDVWRDVSGFGRDVTQPVNEQYRPSLVTNPTLAADKKVYGFNFNPFYYFDGTNDYFFRQGDLYFPNINSAGTTYGVMLNSTRGGWNSPYGWADDDPGLNRGDGRYDIWRENGQAVYTTDIDARTMPAHIAGMGWRGTNLNGVYLNVDGKVYANNSTHIYTLNNNRTPPNFAIGSEGHVPASYGYELFQGGIAEVFAYSTDHVNSGGDELQRINSYLAIKYGITLRDAAGTGVPDYLSSNSVVIWSADDNDGYNNNIAGIGKDDNSALHQKQSRSNKAGQQVLIGTTGLANTNGENGTGLNEGQFLVWGDNGQSKALGVPHEKIEGGVNLNLRFNAVWKVQNTGSVGTVRVAWPSGTVNLHLVISDDDVIETSDDHLPMSGMTVIDGLVYNYADVTLEDGTYFTFAGYIKGPGGVGQDLALWYRADNGVETDGEKKVAAWNNSTTVDVKLTPNSSQPYIPYNDQSTFTKTWNFNPTLTFDGTNNYLRNTTTPYLTTTGTVHYVTVARLAQDVSGYRNMFSINGNDDGFFIYRNGILPTSLNTVLPTIGNGFNITSAGPVTTEMYGIYSAALPKGPGQRGFYNGLEKIFTTPYPYTGSSYSLPATGAYVGADGTTGDNWKGEIAEVIVYHNTDAGDIDNADLARIHSYLAIKYGITLDQTSPQNYINSASQVVWDATANDGFNHNIAGIARDDEGGLNQKQSNSVNPGLQVLISTTGLANTNLENFGLLDNMQYLVWGDNGLNRSPMVPISGVSGVNFRFESVWKVQNKGNVGTVRVAWRAGLENLKLIRSSSPDMDTDRQVDDMDNIIEVNGIEYAYADVTLSDGEYFTFAADLRAPGGVGGPVVWLRADAGTPTTVDDTPMSEWVNLGYAGGVTEAVYPERGSPVWQANAHNFNPAIRDKNAVRDGLVLKNVFPSQAHRPLASMVVQSQTNLGIQGSMISYSSYPSEDLGMGSRDKPWMGSTSATTLWYWWDDGYSGTPIFPNSTVVRRYPDVPSINAYHFPQWTANPHTTTLSMNGASNQITGSLGSAAVGVGQHLLIMADAGSNNESINSSISEIISYDRDLTENERARVNSYLAIKYGITLFNANGTETPEYLSSNSVTIYPSDATYRYNVAGIGRDDISALHQKQSRSVNTQLKQVIVAANQITETNRENPGELGEGQFLVWADNNFAQTLSVAAGRTQFNFGGLNTSVRMNRIWKVENTGVDQQVVIRFAKDGIGDYDLGTGECQGLALLIADNADFENAVALPLTATEDGNDIDASYTFSDGVTYFTYGKVTPYNTGVAFLPQDMEVSDEFENCGVGEWVYFHKNGEKERNLMGFSGFSNAEMDNMSVIITPEGVLHDGGDRVTRLMKRITTVADDEATYSGSNKVRIYYDPQELNETEVPDAVTSGWFKYEGDASEVLIDVYADGLLDPTKTIEVVPAATGTEDGVPYVEFHNVTSFSSFVYLSTTSSTPLPVRLVDFSVRAEGETALLSWSTANESDNAGFEVMRSGDGRNWDKIGYVDAGKGESNFYRFVDADPIRGMSYYRLRQIDLSGKSELSHVISLTLQTRKAELSVYPNPTRSGYVEFELKDAEVASVKVLNMLGVEVPVSKSGKQLQLKGLSGGQYILQVKTTNGESYTKIFLVE